MADKPTNKERLKELGEKIEAGIREVFDSGKYAEYLKVMSRFPTYSVNNQMLIRLQRPNATKVAGYNKWQQFERHVKRGEHGITIIAPTPYKKKIEEQKLDPDTKAPVLDANGKVVMEEKEIEIPTFRPIKVFDYAQTEGKPLPQLAADLFGNVQHYEAFMEALRRTSPVPLTIEPMQDNMDGFFSPTAQRIAIRQGMSEVQTVCACIHEMTHATLHNYEKQRMEAAAGDPSKEPPKPKPHQIEEIEAESTSYMVCQYFGIETGENSFGYVASYCKDRELSELRACLNTINKTAGSMIAGIEKHFAEVCKEQGIDLSEQKNEPEQTVPAAEEPAAEEPAAPELDPMDQPAPEQEKLLLLDEAVYLHLQTTEGGYDYTLYDKDTLRQMDGGQLDAPELPLSTAALKICEMHDLGGQSIKYAPLAMIETLQEAAYQQMQEAAAQAAVPESTMLPDAPEQTLDEYPMPDPMLTLDDLEKCGYRDGDMLPLSKERAMELYERDLTVYAVVDGGGAEMLFDREEFDTQAAGTMYAVSREEWEESSEFDARVQDRLNHQEERERAFLSHEGDCFAIYQVAENDPQRLRFMNMDWLNAHDLSVERSNYDLVYTAPLSETGSIDGRLHKLFEQFNFHRPADFHSPSMSVSDIVAIKRDGVVSCHYCDSACFQEIPGFLPSNPLKNAEMTVEDDYGMIDGIINNGPKATVAELEAQARSGQPISLMDLADAVHREERDKKKSVMEQLRQSPKQERKKTAPKKSAEREL
ncbi:Antirestriction protein [Blautia hydrogenotrophica]|uniref:YodL domain-containing protein n=1 Tax=Clostridia TaxID=186801 RepID=UPI0006C51E72|nr:LPD16 domain-containing protein [Blautia hydrogenotrophica]CUM79665.1 Antirestriction protein [Blautia hydrogenotrophica]SCH39555.1 Antirestriction protein [uncultured Blautia sp.]